MNQDFNSEFYTIDLQRSVFDGSELILLSFLGEIGAVFREKHSGIIEVKHSDSSVIEALRRVQNKRKESKVSDSQHFDFQSNCEETGIRVSGG